MNLLNKTFLHRDYLTNLEVFRKLYFLEKSAGHKLRFLIDESRFFLKNLEQSDQLPVKFTHGFKTSFGITGFKFVVDVGCEVSGANVEFCLFSSFLCEIVGQHSPDFIVSFVLQFKVISAELNDIHTFAVDSDQFFDELWWFFGPICHFLSLSHQIL